MTAARSKVIDRMAPPGPLAGRLQHLRQALQDCRADAILVTSPHDQFYLTGFTGEDGAVLVTSRTVWLLTDGRFKEQAEREASWAKALLRKTGLAKAAGDLAGKLKVHRLLVQPEVMTLDMAAALKKALPKPAGIARAGGVVRKMRLTKGPEEIEAIRAAIRVGEQAFEVLRRKVRPGMTEAEVAGLVEYEMRKRGASGPSFPTIAAVDGNAALPHYRPGDVRVPKNGLLLVMSKPQVKAVLINILGGITRCDMVATGVVEGLKAAPVKKPIAVRMMGTNEKEGQEILRQNGIGYYPDMEQAAAAIIRN